MILQYLGLSKAFLVVASHLGLLAVWLKVDDLTAPKVQSLFEQSKIAVMEITEQRREHLGYSNPDRNECQMNQNGI